MLRGRKRLRAEDMLQFDENRGTDMTDGTSNVGIVGIVGIHKGGRAQRNNCPLGRPDLKMFKVDQGGANEGMTLRNSYTQ